MAGRKLNWTPPWKRMNRWHKTRYLANGVPGIAIPRVLGGKFIRRDTAEGKLAGHIAAAHDGQVDQTCNACKELQAKIDKEKSNEAQK